jgi:hypothetical protein
MIGKSMAKFAVKTLDLFPPLTKTVFCASNALILVPLDAKQASPLSARGRFFNSSSCQVFPPSELLVMKNLPSIGSPTTAPLCSSRIPSHQGTFPLFYFHKPPSSFHPHHVFLE